MPHRVPLFPIPIVRDTREDLREKIKFVDFKVEVLNQKIDGFRDNLNQKICGYGYKQT